MTFLHFKGFFSAISITSLEKYARYAVVRSCSGQVISNPSSMLCFVDFSQKLSTCNCFYKVEMHFDDLLPLLITLLYMFYHLFLRKSVFSPNRDLNVLRHSGLYSCYYYFFYRFIYFKLFHSKFITSNSFKIFLPKAVSFL